ncbi:MAG: L-serine ammonia-lyase [Verrucomicrobiales bacterium VVV1]|nr:MAG: L-serine ammonia-lyase [Verrucomicrobiales bacterium VVV1]
MTLSALDLFTIGIGPSSSHTVGPMRAACRFVRKLEADGVASKVSRLKCDLYGSLAATGKGHGTDVAILMGFCGEEPKAVDVEGVPERLATIRAQGRLMAPWGSALVFNEKEDLDFKRLKPLPLHPNGMHFLALDEGGEVVAEEVFYSMGGGFIATEAELKSAPQSDIVLPHPFANAAELMRECESSGLSISGLMWANEAAVRPMEETRAKLDAIWNAMQDCVKRGCSQDGLLPGGLKVKRRAKAIHENLCHSPEAALKDPLTILDWVNLYALAVNEENAAGGRVVTAPTNGAAGIVPAVLQCLGGTPKQVENAAEIGMEHNLGLTCDPIGGLVQIPCIERNAMGSVKAINASRLALSGDGTHFVSLDKVIKTMRETGRDMKSKYKETSRGGLAVNVVEC